MKPLFTYSPLVVFSAMSYTNELHTLLYTSKPISFAGVSWLCEVVHIIIYRYYYLLVARVEVIDLSKKGGGSVLSTC